MQINVQAKQGRVVPIDIDNNLEAPEEKQFCVILKEPSKWDALQFKAKVVSAKDASKEFLAAFFVGFKNPFEIVVEDEGEKGEPRVVTFDDLFVYDALYPILDQICTVVQEIRKEEDKDSRPN